MKRSLLTVAVFGVLGAALGGAWGYMIASSETCEIFADHPGATCYVLFGNYVSEFTYHALVEPFQGLLVGLGIGLLTVLGGSTWRRLAQTGRTPSRGSA